MGADIVPDSQADNTSFAAVLTEKLEATGWIVRLTGDFLGAEKEAILAKWLLGSRRVKHRLLLRLDATTRKLTLKEISTETSIGIPPPAFSVTFSKQQGLEVVQDRVDTGIGGGGVLHYGEPRKWIEQECARAGWAFRLAIGAV